MFNFKVTIHKLSINYLYFFIPSMISEILNDGDSIKIRFKKLSYFEKQLTAPRIYFSGNKKHKLFMVIIPKIFAKNNKIKHNKEYEVTIELKDG